MEFFPSVTLQRSCEVENVLRASVGPVVSGTWLKLQFFQTSSSYLLTHPFLSSGTKEKVLIDILTHRSSAQRQLICEAYQEATGRVRLCPLLLIIYNKKYNLILACSLKLTKKHFITGNIWLTPIQLRIETKVNLCTTCSPACKDSHTRPLCICMVFICIMSCCRPYWTT